MNTVDWLRPQDGCAFERKSECHRKERVYGIWSAINILPRTINFFLPSLLITISYKLSFTNVTFSCKYTTHLRHVLRTWYLLYSSCRKKKRPFRTFVPVSEEYIFNSYTVWEAFGFVNGHIVLYWFCISVSEIRKKTVINNPLTEI